MTMKKINLLLVNIDKEYSSYLLDEINKIKMISYVLIFDVKKPSKKYNFNYDFFNIEKSHYGNYGVNLSDLDLLDENLKSNFSKYEQITLKMLDRGFKPQKMTDYHFENDEKYGDKISNLFAEPTYQFRNIILQRHLRFWNHYINNKKINYYFCTTIPHIVSDFVPYLICETKKIETLFCAPSLYWGLLIPFKSVNDNFEQIKKSYIKNLKNLNPNNIRLCDLNKKYFKKMTTKITPPIESTQNKELFFYPRKRSSFGVLQLKLFYSLIRMKFRLTKFHLIRYYYERKYFNKIISLRRYLQKISKKKLPNKKFIYFPLHFEPEASTVPMGGYEYYDQLKVIKILAYYSKKNNFKLVIKEHPYQKSVSRSFEFYDEIIAHDSVIFMDTEYDSLEILKKASLVATITGTIGWEALFTGKPVICFGESILKIAPSVFSPKSVKDIDKFFREYKSFVCSHNEIKIFLKTLEKFSLFAFNVWKDPKETFEIFNTTPAKVSNKFINLLKQNLK